LKHAYVYYRVDGNAVSRAAASVDSLLADLAAYCAEPPQRLARCDDPTTWMEVYAGIDDWQGFIAAMADHLQRSPLTPYLEGERHVECFSAVELRRS
jgi:hypothetical protein